MRKDIFSKLESRIEDLGSTEWIAPVGYTVGQDFREISDLLDEGLVDRVVDPFDDIIDDLYEYHHPDKTDDVRERGRFHEMFAGARSTFGRWFYFPWARELVRYPDQPDHYDLRTSRNRNLITADEQARLYDGKIAVLGLSVGRSALNALVLSGIGKEYLLTDPDVISVSNLNRMTSDMSEVGLKKTVSAGRYISRIDPYINQVHISDGYNHVIQETVEKFSPSIIVEEMDDLEAKMIARQQALRLKTPLLMATDIGERSILEVERYDLSSATRPFHGRLGRDLESKLRAAEELTDSEKRKALIKINGIKNLSPRLIDSALEIGSTLPGMTQLGRTALIGGALVAAGAQEILLGRKLNSGSYNINQRAVLKGRSISTPSETVATFKRLIGK